MPVFRIHGFALPGGDPVDLYADGDRWTTDPLARAELVAEGWLLPGLVDAHTHPGAEAPGKPLDEAVLREDLREHAAAGVTMIRAPGLAGIPPIGSAAMTMFRGGCTPDRGSRSTASSSTGGGGALTMLSCRSWLRRRRRGPAGPK